MESHVTDETPAQSEEKKKSKKDKKPKTEKKEEKSTEAPVAAGESSETATKKEEPVVVVDPVHAAKEALLKRASQAASKNSTGKTSQEVAKQEILQRQNKVKRAQGKKKEDL